MKSKLALAGVLAGVFLLPGCDSSWTIINGSDYVLTGVYITPSGDDDWGPNYGPLYEGESVTVYVTCGDYDIMVISGGTECFIYDEYLCYEDADWKIFNETLDHCAFF